MRGAVVGGQGLATGREKAVNIHESTNPRHAIDPLNLAVAVFAMASIVVGCIVLPPVPDPVDPVAPTTTTTTTIPDSAGLVLPEFLCGGIGAGDWPGLSASTYADALLTAGCNSHLIEFLAPAFDKSPDGYNDLTIKQVTDKVIAWVKTMQGHGVWTCIHVVNGNDEVWQHFSQAQMQGAMQRLFAECGTRFIVLIPVAEMQEDNDNEFASWCVGYWHDRNGGICGWNGRGRPSTVPAGYQVCDYHLQALDDMGPELPGVITLLDTDNGPAINSLRAYWNPDKVDNWARMYHSRGRSLNLYQFQSTEIDVEALRRVGEAYK